MEKLPLQNQKILIIFTLLIMMLTVTVSTMGLIFQNKLYTTEELLLSFVPNDYVNLIIGFPLMLISLILVYKKKLVGLLMWPGALFYIIYVYFPYLICVPVNYLFIPYLLLFSMSIYVLIALMASIDYTSMEGILPNKKQVRFPAGVLLGLSALIIIRQLVLMFSAISVQSAVGLQEVSLWIDDFAIASPMMILSGIFLWKKKTMGYVSAPGLLLAYACLSFSLLPFLYIQSVMKKSYLDWGAVIILGIMTVLCLIPFAKMLPKKM